MHFCHQHPNHIKKSLKWTTCLKIANQIRIFFCNIFYLLLHSSIILTLLKKRNVYSLQTVLFKELLRKHCTNSFFWMFQSSIVRTCVTFFGIKRDRHVHLIVTKHRSHTKNLVSLHFLTTSEKKTGWSFVLQGSL